MLWSDDVLVMDLVMLELDCDCFYVEEPLLGYCYLLAVIYQVWIMIVYAVMMAKFCRAGLEARIILWWMCELYPIPGRAMPDSGNLGRGATGIMFLLLMRPICWHLAQQAQNDAASLNSDAQ